MGAGFVWCHSSVQQKNKNIGTVFKIKCVFSFSVLIIPLGCSSMSADKDKYRNPPPPLGYVRKEPRLVLTEKKKDGLDIGYLIDQILESGICDEPDYRIYEKFVINSGSEEEGQEKEEGQVEEEDEDIVELPFVPVPKNIEIVKVDDDDENIPHIDNVVIKKEKCSPERVSQEKKVKVKEEEEIKIKKHKKPKKRGERHRSSSKRRRKHKTKRELDGKSEDKRSPSKLVDYSSDSSGSRSRSRYKKKSYSRDGSSSDSVYKRRHKSSSRSSSYDYDSRHKEKVSHKSKTDAHRRHRYKRRESYSSYSSDNDSRYRSRDKKRSYSRDKSDSDRDDKSHLKSKYSHRSDSHNRRLKTHIDSDSNSSISKKEVDTDYTYTRIVRKRATPSPPPVAENFDKMSITEEQKFLHGEYRCNICNITLNNDTTYRSHMSGKRHKKAVEASKRTIPAAAKMLLPDSKVAAPDPKVAAPDPKVAAPDPKVTAPDPKVSVPDPRVPVPDPRVSAPSAVPDPRVSAPSAVPDPRVAVPDPRLLVPNPRLPVTDLRVLLSTKIGSKYPQPPPGYRRVKVDSLSLIQEQCDRLRLDIPLPGLDKVIEILGITETTYYCAFCDCSCNHHSIMNHLNGHKHQLNSLKYYRQDLYDKWNYIQKSKIQKDVTNVLRDEEKRHGTGFIQVQKDVKDTSFPVYKTEKKSWRDEPSTSTQAKVEDYYETFKNSSVPDPSKHGFYCKMCDSHCNSEAMWNSHVVGKRHLTNLKKNPGAAPSKCKYVPADEHTQPMLYKILEEENVPYSPIVGLDQIREIQKPDIKSVQYTCYLCGACMSSQEIYIHIISMKHREKYLNSINHPRMEILQTCALSESYRHSIIEEICESHEQEFGPGKPDVYYTKSAVLRY